MRSCTHVRRAAAVLALTVASRTPLGAQPAGSLPRATPESQGVASRDLLTFVRTADSLVDAMHGLMVVRHGRVIAEGWWAPHDSATRHVLFSLSKSFTSTAVGLAVADGKLSLDDPVLRWFPDDAPATPSENLRDMRVRDLLRMTTGHAAEPTIWPPAGPSARDDSTWVRRFLAAKVDFQPGTIFVYNTPATYMLSAIVQKATGQTTFDYLRPRLFAPLGIAQPAWAMSPDGITLGGFGLEARTEDIAKLGLLYLQRGRWNGTALIPEGWVDTATTRQTSNGSTPTSDWSQGYGFQFWRSRHGYRGDGAFGQYMLVLPEYDAVIAINSGVSNMQAVLDIVWRTLLPAFRRGALAEDAAAQGALRDALARLAMPSPRGRATSPLAARVAGRWYDVAPNDRGVRAVRLEAAGPSPALVVRTDRGETRTPIGTDAWPRPAVGFLNGLERELSVPAHARVSARGAWTSDSTFSLRLVSPETPYHTTMTFHFDGVDRVRIDGRHHVSFVRSRLPALEGRAEVRTR